MSFWNNKPLNTYGNDISFILHREILFNQITYELNNQVNVEFTKTFTISSFNTLNDEHIEFIQKYYYNHNNIKLHYSKELLITSLGKKFIILELRKDNVIVGLITAKKTMFYINKRDGNGNLINTVDINYLCLHPVVRNKNLSTYLINKITLCVLKTYKSINCAFYTVGHKINDNYYSEKSIYHIPINNNLLLESKFINKPHNLMLNETNSSKIYQVKTTTKYKQLIREINLWNAINFNLSEHFPYDNVKNFHHFYDGKNYMCLFQLNNIINGIELKVGYIYKTNFKDTNTFNSFIKYIKDNKVYDIVNTTIYFDTSNLLKGTGTLYYYAYNLNMPKINSNDNAIVTI